MDSSGTYLPVEWVHSCCLPRCHSNLYLWTFGVVFCFVCFLLFFVLVEPCNSGILVPQPRIKPAPLAVEAESSNHWSAREFLRSLFLNVDKDVCLISSGEIFYFYG